MPGTVSEIEAYAEAPASHGDLYGALARWQAVLARNAHPHATIYCARYFALTGRSDEARAMADDVRRGLQDKDFMLTVARRLYVSSLGDIWIRTCNAISTSKYWRGVLAARIVQRVLRADFLFELRADEAQMAIRLMTLAAESAVEPGSYPGAVAFGGAQGSDQEIAAILAFVQPSAADVRNAFGVVLEHFVAGRLGTAPIMRFAGRFGLRRAGADESAAPERSVDGSGDVMLSIVEAFPDYEFSPDMARAMILAGLADQDTWVISHGLERLRQIHPRAAGLAVLRAELSYRTGDAALSLARTLARLGSAGAPAISLDAAASLAVLGHLRLAAEALEINAQTDEEAAYRRATYLGQLAPESRSASAWRAAFEAHGTPRIGRGLALALADQGEGPAAETQYRSAAEASGGLNVWRPWASSLERTGRYKDWQKLIEKLEEEAPQTPWLLGERIKHSLETGCSLPDQPTTSIIQQKAGIELQRTMARVLSVKGEFSEVVRLRRAIAGETHAADDQYNVVMALCQAGDFDEASVLLDRLLTYYPGDYRNHVKRAQLHERSNDYNAALRCFAKSLEIEPGNRDGAAGIARCLTYLDAFDRCEKWLMVLPEKDPLYVWKHAARAFNAARRGRENDARIALAAWHASASDVLQTLARRAAESPGLIWIAGRQNFASSSSMDMVEQRFNADIDWLREGSIILVGNSPNLIGQRHGSLIDKFQRVIRLNDFQTENYEPDVGSRTDLWFSSANRLAKPNVNALDGTRIWLSQPYPQHLPDLVPFARGRLGLSLDPSKAAFLPSYIHFLSNNFAYPRPSSGFRVMMMLELIVRRNYATIGFSFFRDSTIHYFEQDASRFAVGEVHAIEFERDFVELVLRYSPYYSSLN